MEVGISSDLAAEAVDQFVHAPLGRNHGDNSIRLLQFCDDASSKDLIQLTMCHTDDWANSTGNPTRYTCLSYRWGDDEATHRILLNRKTKYIRKNLWDFLDIWRQRTQIENRWFWIDALCIDQTNVTERNHQVQQMGQIYSNAEEVIIWLGKQPALHNVLSSVFSTFEQPAAALYGTEWTRTQENIEMLRECILLNEYWNRAWITQEVVLARKKILAVHDQRIRLETFIKSLHSFRIDYEDARAFKQIVTYKSNFSSDRMIDLLSRFRNKHCSIPRDRIYSLLSICRDGLKVTVDYDLPEPDLMYRVLRQQMLFCFCTAVMVSQTLDMANASQVGDGPPGTQVYFRRRVSRGNVLSKTRASYNQLGSPTSIIKSVGAYFDYSLCFKFCINKYVTVSWNSPGTSNENMLVWTDTFEKGDIVGCKYGDGFEIGENAQTWVRMTLDERRTTLAAFWEQVENYDGETYKYELRSIQLLAMDTADY
jgi:hypothetical protein